MYFHIKLIAKWENNQIKTIEIEQNGEKNIFSVENCHLGRDLKMLITHNACERLFNIW